jgi:hypothetical protein
VQDAGLAPAILFPYGNIWYYRFGTLGLLLSTFPKRRKRMAHVIRACAARKCHLGNANFYRL